MDLAEDKLKVEEEQANMEDENGEFDDQIVTAEEGGLFKERYALHEELGKGRYGVVRRVVEKRSGRCFAAKFVRTARSSDRQQVREEMKIMNILRHPKLLRLTAAFESPKEIVMVTEYISGGELFERVVADDFTLTEKDSILFMRQICEGVRYMHEHNVVHLDLKPENIMCHTRTSHRIKLIDFGLAQILQPDSPVRVMFGTPEFIPPEIINYEPIGTESDMWSVGVICYVLLTGLSPFMGDNDSETFANIIRADYDFEDEAFDAISPDAKDFISNLLQKKKELRMSAKHCLSHSWLAQHTESMSRVALPTDKLKKFIVRRKWQKTGNALRALGRMAMLSASRRSPSLSPTSTRSLGEVARSESLDSEEQQESGGRGESSQHEGAAAESLVKDAVGEDAEEEERVDAVEDIGPKDEDVAVASSAETDGDVCGVTRDENGNENVREESSRGEIVHAVRTNVTEEVPQELDVEESDTHSSLASDTREKVEESEDKSYASEEEVSEIKEAPGEESDEITVLEKEESHKSEDTEEEEEMSEESKDGQDESSKSEGVAKHAVDSTRVEDSRGERIVSSKFEKICDARDDASLVQRSIFTLEIGDRSTNNGDARLKLANNSIKETKSILKSSSDVAGLDRDASRRSFHKFKLQYEAHPAESPRLESHGRFYMPTGNVSRTAKLFEQLETENGNGAVAQHQPQQQQHPQEKQPSPPSSAATSGKAARSERIQRAFAFWNK